MSSKEKTQIINKDREQNKNRNQRHLILYNDDYHSFDYVITALIEICDHDKNQATQCTMLAHYKGKCEIKKGSFAYLSPMRRALAERDLQTTIN